ncbi:MAG: excinuclease ABC subunit A, partial [Planctomycetes bacterium]|nr:excinuclease ABC subunit A [Planctomycetota bacterium]
AGTLSGGEAQRIQLASQIGSGLTGVLYVLDEPTIGLHPRDNHRLLQALARLRDLGNTLLVVEHDREVIDSADHVLDFGPGAGTLGGTITAACSPKRIRSKRASLTGRYLSYKEAIPIPSNRRPVPRLTDRRMAQDEPLSRRLQPARTFEWGTDEDDSGRFGQDEIDDSGDIAQLEIDDSGRFAQKEVNDSGRFAQAEACGSGKGVADGGIDWLIVHGAREHNLKEIDAAFPLGRFTCVTGVSGSGKSTLVSAILYNALAARIHRARVVPGGHDRITGIDPIDKVINVDASPIGNSPTSNPATYTGVFDAVRELFAKLPMSKIRGYTANRFSFNRPGGRCEACQGMGQRCIEMHFLPDVWVECEPCRGKRYVPETLEVRYRGKNIADVLEMSVHESLELFQQIPQVRRMLQTLDDVGLGYVQLGQPAPTLSGGEAQRVKLAAELGRPSTGKTLYILDEPTTGLHFDDLKKLLNVLHRLVDSGNTVICIEHNLDVIKTADWVIDLGPEAGQAGGWIVVADTPERVACTKDSHTGVALAPVLAAGPLEERPVYGPTRDDGSQRSKWEESVRTMRTESTHLDESIGLPWERDGQTWHTLNHVDRKGTQIEWDAAVLVWIVETIESLGQFAKTHWNHRTRIEIKAPGQQPWFCHILTGGKDLLEVALRVSRGTFRQAGLVNKLSIKTLDERTDLPIYGQWSRARLRSCSAGWEEVRLYLRDFKDVAKGRFRAFLKTAVGGYFAELERAEAQPDRAQPWKSDGRQWHLSQKSIHGRHVIRWKQDLLLAMVGRFKAMDPQLEVSWESKTAVRFFLSNGKRLVGKIVTNMGRGLRVELRAPSGVLTPTQVERLGEDVEIAVHGGHDHVRFWVRTLSQNDSRQMHDIWRKCRLRIADEGLQSA